MYNTFIMIFSLAKYNDFFEKTSNLYKEMNLFMVISRRYRNNYTLHLIDLISFHCR